jgi:hypothetical protein
MVWPELSPVALKPAPDVLIKLTVTVPVPELVSVIVF